MIVNLNNVQPLDGDLTAIAALSGISGFLTKTAANTWVLDTNTYLTSTTAATTYQPLIALTQGSVLFMGASGVSQDNSNFFYDSTNTRFGFGVTAPASFIVATGVQPVSVATSTGTSSSSTGNIRLTPSKGGDTTISTTGTGGTGGSLIFTTGQGGAAPSATTNSTGGLSGQISLSTAIGTSVAIVSSTSNTGGASGPISFQVGNGGVASLSTGTNTGGNGGLYTLVSGTGGNAGTASAGSGGNIAIGGNGGSFSNTSGNGGLARNSSASSIGGDGGNYNIVSGNGGNATGSGSNIGGNAGNINLTAGTAGTGSTSNGSNGSINFSTAAGTNLMVIDGAGLISLVGSLKFTGSSPTNGYVLTSDASGNATWQSPAGGGITVGSTTITSGTTTRILYNNAGVVGEYTISGTGNVAMTTSPTFTTDITSPKHIGGTGTTSKISYVGSTNASVTTTAIAHDFFGGNSGTTSYGKMYQNGSWNLGVATQNTFDTKALRVGEGSAIVDIGAWRNDGASGVIVFNQVSNDSGQYALRGNATTTVVNARSSTVSLAINDVNQLVVSGARILFQPAAATSGSSLSIPFYFYQPSSTALTASTEVNCLILDRAGSTQWSTGALTTQRDVFIKAPTYRFVGASTITTAATVAIEGAPIASTNATITTSLALWVQGGVSRFDGVVRLKGYTVATLPTGVQGDTAFVTDALAPTFLAVIVGGGAIVTKVFHNGTNWVAQ